MKIINLEKGEITENLKKNIHISIGILVTCILLGLICGIYQKYTYKETEPEPYVDEEQIYINDIDQDKEYYFTAFDRLIRQTDCLDLYFSYFQDVGLSVENKQKLDDVKDVFNKHYEQVLGCEDYFWNKPMSKGNADDTAYFYREKARSLDEKKRLTEDLYSKGLASGSLSDIEKEEMETQIVYIEQYVWKLEKLTEQVETATLEELQSNNEKGDELLRANIESINEVIDRFNTVMREISEEENYYIINSKYRFTNQGETFGLLKISDKKFLKSEKLNEAIIYAKSHEGLDSGEERMYAIITFFTLFGIIVAVTFGALYSPKKRKEQQNAIQRS